MGGCAMIGQSVINVRSGATTRLSTFTAGVFLIVLIIVFRGLGRSNSYAYISWYHDYGICRNV